MNYKEDVVVSSRVRLARNYADIPFSAKETAVTAKQCEERTLSAFTTKDNDLPFTLYKMSELEDVDKYYLAEKHLISYDLIRKPDTGSAYIRSDHQVSIMINEEDHLRIQAISPGERLSASADSAYEAEDVLQSHVHFAFDTKLGYLTTCPTNVGTGMRASLMLHLPLLTSGKQMGSVNQTVVKLGLTIRGIHGEGSEALGNLYQISNQATLGRTETEILDSVISVGDKLIDMERDLRFKADTANNAQLEDMIFRSYGLLKYARRMSQKEFLSHWSNLRLGISMGRCHMEVETVDALLEDAQDAHIMKWAGELLTGDKLDEARSLYIRRQITKKHMRR